MEPASTDRPVLALRGLVQRWSLPVALVAVGGGLALLWGLSWGWSDFPDCAGGSSFLFTTTRSSGLLPVVFTPVVGLGTATWGGRDLRNHLDTMAYRGTGSMKPVSRGLDGPPHAP